MKKLLIAIAAVPILVVGGTVWVWESTLKQHPVGATATFDESADCLVRYVNALSVGNWELDAGSVEDCFPRQTVAKRKALIACFNKYERSHSATDHKGWPEDNMRGCRWDRVADVGSLDLGNPLAVPAVPRAGKRFDLTVGVTRNDSAGEVADAAITTDMTLDVAVTIDGEVVVTTPLTHLEYGFDRRVHVSLTLPETAAGKRLTIKMTIAADRLTATKIVTFTVAR